MLIEILNIEKAIQYDKLVFLSSDPKNKILFLDPDKISIEFIINKIASKIEEIIIRPYGFIGAKNYHETEYFDPNNLMDLLLKSLFNPQHIKFVSSFGNFFIAKSNIIEEIMSRTNA